MPCLRIPLSNASSAASQPPSHGWGPGWLATPSLYDSFIRSGRSEAQTGSPRCFLAPPYHSVRRVFPSTAARLAFQTVPSPRSPGLSPHPACPKQPVGLRPPFVRSAAPPCVLHCVRTVSSVVHCHSRSWLLYPRGPRSGRGSAVPVHPHLIGLMRPTPRHIPISSQCGLYEMPSPGGCASATHEWFRAFAVCPFLTCRPLRPRGVHRLLAPSSSPLAMAFAESRPARHSQAPSSSASHEDRNFGAYWFTFAAACQVARLPGGSDRVSPSRRRLLLPSFPRVGHPSRGRV
jgi:hypothetical protein